jgi:hypothetical protein
MTVPVSRNNPSVPGDSMLRRDRNAALVVFGGFFIASLLDGNLLLGMESQPHTFHPSKYPKEQ